MLIIVIGVLVNFWRTDSEILNIAKVSSERIIELSKDQTDSLNQATKKFSNYKTSYAAAVKHMRNASAGGAKTESINKLRQCQVGMIRYAESVRNNLLATIPSCNTTASSVSGQLVVGHHFDYVES